jgi:hypothetical protein
MVKIKDVGVPTRMIASKNLHLKNLHISAIMRQFAFQTCSFFRHDLCCARSDGLGRDGSGRMAGIARNGAGSICIGSIRMGARKG